MVERRRKLKTSAGQKHAGKVMELFHEGKLRSSSGETVTDEQQAKAIAMSEGRAVEERGKKMRQWRGRRRMRPVLKKG